MSQPHKENYSHRTNETADLLDSMMHYPEILEDIGHSGNQWNVNYPDLTIPPLGASHEDLMQDHSYHLSPSSIHLPSNLSNHIRTITSLELPHQDVETHHPFPSISGSPHDIFHPNALHSSPFNLPFSNPVSSVKPVSTRRHKSQNNALQFSFKVKLATSERVSDKIYQLGLSKVSVSEEGLFLCGTDSKANPCAIGGILYDEKLNFITKACAKPIRDVHWERQHNKFLLAMGNSIGVASWEGEITENSFQVKEIHKVHLDDIREIALDHHNSHLLLSGGFDKRLLITDMSTETVTKPYYTRHVIGSVRWYPTCVDVVSFTSDVGSISMFDIRDHSPRVPIVYHSGKPIYSHEYISQNVIALGGQDGEIDLFDIRMKSIIQQLNDPDLETIGDIQGTENYLVVSGVSGVTFWEETEDGLEKIGNNQSEQSGDSACATFRAGKPSVIVTDSGGYLSVFNYVE